MEALLEQQRVCEASIKKLRDDIAHAIRTDPKVTPYTPMQYKDVGDALRMNSNISMGQLRSMFPDTYQDRPEYIEAYRLWYEDHCRIRVWYELNPSINWMRKSRMVQNGELRRIKKAILLCSMGHDVSAVPVSKSKKQKQQEVGVGEENVCVICYEQDTQVKLSPCNHKVTCLSCANSMRMKDMNTCPMCRSVVESFSMVW